MRQEIPGLIHNIDTLFAIRDSHVHMQSEDQIYPRNLLHILDDGGVALIHRDELIHPVRERMCASGGDLESIARRQFRQLATKIDNLLSRATRVMTDLRAKLHDRLMHLGLDLLLQDHFAASQKLLDMRAQLARFRINDLELFLDAEREDVILHRGDILMVPTKNAPVIRSQKLLDMRAQLARFRINDLELFLDAEREDVILHRGDILMVPTKNAPVIRRGARELT